MYINKIKSNQVSLETFLKALKNKEAYRIILDSSLKYFTSNIYYNQKCLVHLIQPPNDIIDCLLKNRIPFCIIAPRPFFIHAWWEIMAWEYTLTDFQSNSMLPTWLIDYKEYNANNVVLIAFKTWASK